MTTCKVLITGAAGYLAGFVIERLRTRYRLTLTDRVEPKGDIHDLDFVPGDITDSETVERICAGQDAVVHLVALVRERFDKPAWQFADVMVKGTWNVAEACAKQGVRRLVNVSSIIACGWPLSEDAPYQVGDPCRFRQADLYYCLAKHLGEEIGRAYHQARDLSVIHIRPGVIAGDGLNQGPRKPDTPSRYWFNYVDPRDVAQAIGCALASDIAYGCYQTVAGRDDALFDWRPTRDELGYRPKHNWEEIP